MTTSLWSSSVSLPEEENRIAIAKKILLNPDSAGDSPKKSSFISAGGLRQSAGRKMLESKEFVETLKLLTRTKHPLLLQCVLETLATVPNMYSPFPTRIS